VDDFFIKDDSFKVWMPNVVFKSAADDAEGNESYNSRQIMGVMTSDRIDRQGESVVAKGLTFKDFLHNGHFNDNHSQATSSIVGYPESVQYHKDLTSYGVSGASGWTCKGYMLKGTKRSDEIWELAEALKSVPNRKLGFSIEGKVIRRKDKTIEKAKIRNVAITNCPVNTDCTWNLLTKSFFSEDLAIKSLSAGFGTSPATQTGGGALRTEGLDSDVKNVSLDKKKKKKKRNDIIRSYVGEDIFGLDDAINHVLERRPDFTEEAAAFFIANLHKRGGTL